MHHRCAAFYVGTVIRCLDFYNSFSYSNDPNIATTLSIGHFYIMDKLKHSFESLDSW